MIEVRWTEHAFENLRGIHDQIALSSPTVAREVAARLWEAVGQIREFPDSGRMVPERRSPDLRELVLPPYRLVYRRRETLIEVLTVFYGTMRFPRRLPGDAR
ncbi:MAG: type II toxin-antitoxin system RelE/ParE family toxin [Gemmatimonadaceae bacterium]|nr:type II toxin-antitoxin system RelE/ParE family toxin [Gemmatimonadaceae bacterium]